MFVRPLTEAERELLEQGAHSEIAYYRRLCQVLLESAKGSRINEILRRVDCGGRASVQHAILKFNEQGMDWLLPLNKPFDDDELISSDDDDDDDDDDE